MALHEESNKNEKPGGLGMGRGPNLVRSIGAAKGNVKVVSWNDRWMCVPQVWNFSRACVVSLKQGNWPPRGWQSECGPIFRTTESSLANDSPDTGGHRATSALINNALLQTTQYYRQGQSPMSWCSTPGIMDKIFSHYNWNITQLTELSRNVHLHLLNLYLSFISSNVLENIHVKIKLTVGDEASKFFWNLTNSSRNCIVIYSHVTCIFSEWCPRYIVFMYSCATAHT